MEQLNSLKNLFFIDIETISCVPSYKGLDVSLQAFWKKKANYINNEKSVADLFVEKAGLFAEFGKIIVIGIGMFYVDNNTNLCFKTLAITGDSEKEVLEKFKEIIIKTDQSNLRFVAHNGKEFDYPYLSKRMLINGMKLPDALDISYKKPWEIHHLDTMAMWKFGDWKSYISLHLLATIFGINNNNNKMEASMVNKVYYEENNLKKIVAYCLQNVIITARLYLKLKGLPELQEENIWYG